MSAPELLGDLAAVFLARTWHRPEGAPMTDQFDIDAEARRIHAEHCRKHNPDVTDRQIDHYWEQIAEESRAGYRHQATQALSTEATA